jgi:hypothetical protein
MTACPLVLIAQDVCEVRASLTAAHGQAIVTVDVLPTRPLGEPALGWAWNRG